MNPELDLAISIIRCQFPMLNSSEIKGILECDFNLIASIEEIECITMELDEEVETKLMKTQIGY